MLKEPILKKEFQCLSGWPLGRVLAHRGGGRLAPENTLAALKVANRFGCGVEFDVMLSADGTLFVIHDETLERTTNGTGQVAVTDDVRLQGLDAGSWFGAEFAGEPVPVAKAFVHECARLGLPMNIEIKPSVGTDRATGRALAELLDAVDKDLPPIVVSSFSEDALQAYRQQGGQHSVGLLVDKIPPDWRERCESLGAVALHADSRYLDSQIVQQARAAGLWLAVYTENDLQHATALWSWGVDCVITDRPDLLVC